MRGFPKAKIICKACGREFETIYKWRNKKFCNRDCYTKFRDKVWDENKGEIIELYNKGFGIWNLEKKFGMSHDFFWQKFKELGIPLNPHAKSLGKRLINLNDSEDLWYIIGCIYGDASAYSFPYLQKWGHKENSRVHRVEMTCKDLDFAETLSNSLKNIGANPHFTTKKSETSNQGFLWKICTDCKPLVKFWDSITDEQVLNLTEQYKIPLIRGIFDSDGTFYHNNGQNSCHISTTIEGRAEFIKKLIESLGFGIAIYKSDNTSKIIKGKLMKTNNPFHYSINIRGGKSEIQRFLELIQPSIERKRWKEN
jgi:intein-encoded DNA endonuclease-like protein